MQDSSVRCQNQALSVVLIEAAEPRPDANPANPHSSNLLAIPAPADTHPEPSSRFHLPTPEPGSGLHQQEQLYSGQSIDLFFLSLAISLQPTEVVGEDGVVWEQAMHRGVLADGTERHVQQAPLIKQK